MTAVERETANAEEEPLALRTRPRPVTRFNRKALVGVAAVICLVILAATLIALEPIRFRAPGQGEELINTERKAKAEGLDSLPRTYADVKPPELGPPLQGDIGPPVVRLERELGVAQGDLRPDAEADAERAERLRLARQAQQARAASVFFQIAAQRDDAALAASSRAVASVPTPQATMSGQGLTPDRERDPSSQGRKIDFLESRTDTDVLNRHALQYPVSADTVLAGTVIAASLVTGINSDLPGFVIAQVTENVFDTVSGRRLLIPQPREYLSLSLDDPTLPEALSVALFEDSGRKELKLIWNRRS